MEKEILNLLSNYGAVGLLFAFFIWQYFKERTKTDAFKNTEKDRKSNINEKQDICLAKLEKDMEFIKNQVSNHLPTSIKSLSDELVAQTLKQENDYKKNSEDHYFMKGCIIKMATKMGVEIEIK